MLRQGAANPHNAVMLDWDDLKYFLAVAHHGSTIAAARALGLNQSTVQRRIAGLERRLGRKLVTRTASGYQLTEFGKERFHARNPNLRVEFVMSDRYLDLSKGEADVAFRSGDTDDELIGRKIADSIWSVYASRGYVDRHGAPQRVEDLSQHALVGFDESMSRHRVAIWLAAVAPNARIVARNNSVLGMLYAVKSGPRSFACWGRFRSWRAAGGY